MRARDVMTTNVVTVTPSTSVRTVAKLLLERRISAAPVVTDQAWLVGIVSEGDLVRRAETGTERHPSWWLSLLASPEDRAIAFIKAHGGEAGDVMTRDVITVNEDAPLEKVAELLEKHRVKRLPVLRNESLQGIVSRADLLRGLVARQASPVVSRSDDKLREAVNAAITDAGLHLQFVTLVVAGGIVHLWGPVESDVLKRAARIAVESVPGVQGIRDEINVMSANVQAMMWAE